MNERPCHAAPPRAGRIILAAGVLAAACLGTACGQERAPSAGDVSAAAPAAPNEPAAHAQHALAQGSEHQHGHDAGEEVAEPASDLSVYQLTSSWTDQQGRARQLRELAGRPQAVALIYTYCGAVCPRVVGDLKRLEAEFPHLGLVLVSIDPERDTPGRLAEFARDSRLGEHWTLLTGSDDALMELAAVLGVRYRRVSATEFVHSVLITILDADGNIAYRQEGLDESAATVAALRRLPGMVAGR